MSSYFFLQKDVTKLFLGPQDQFTVQSALKSDAQKFATKEDALTKLSNLSLTQDTVNIIALSVPNNIPTKK